jgi:hypothetical protein
MYAQQKNDSKSIEVLDSIIQTSNNEIFKERASNLKTEIKSRKNTEQYLTQLEMDKISKESAANKTSSSNVEISKVNTIDVSKVDIVNTSINGKFNNDSSESHYIGLVTNNTNAFMVTKIKDSLFYNFKADFINKKISSTISQLDDKFYIIWIGPFNNFNQSKNYLNNISPIIKKGLMDYLTTDKFDFITISKSNIVKINSYNTYKEYKKYFN